MVAPLSGVASRRSQWTELWCIPLAPAAGRTHLHPGRLTRVPRTKRASPLWVRCLADALLTGRALGWARRHTSGVQPEERVQPQRPRDQPWR